MKRAVKVVVGAVAITSLFACSNTFDYYSPYYSSEPHAPAVEPNDEYQNNHSAYDAAEPVTRQSHGAQYSRPAAPTASHAPSQSSSSNPGALSKKPRIESQKPAYPAPPVVE